MFVDFAKAFDHCWSQHSTTEVYYRLACIFFSHIASKELKLQMSVRIGKHCAEECHKVHGLDHSSFWFWSMTAIGELVRSQPHEHYRKVNKGDGHWITERTTDATLSQARSWRRCPSSSYLVSQSTTHWDGPIILSQWWLRPTNFCGSWRNWSVTNRPRLLLWSSR